MNEKRGKKRHGIKHTVKSIIKENDGIENQQRNDSITAKAMEKVEMRAMMKKRKKTKYKSTVNEEQSHNKTYQSIAVCVQYTAQWIHT